MSQRYIWNNVYKLVNNQNIMKIHLDLTSSDAQIKWFHKVSKPTQPWNQRRFQCHYRNNSLQTCSTSNICNSTVWKHMPPSLCYLSYHAMLENCIANVFHFVGSSKKCTCIQIEIFDKNATKEKNSVQNVLSLFGECFLVLLIHFIPSHFFGPLASPWYFKTLCLYLDLQWCIGCFAKKFKS